ncbi:CCHC-type zinc finger, nucleic acid binding protein a [Elysia marginata]|uniref:CCHC-type zinc finger, nucleic acid binding protein a n=1 Tax=Elysia marginata TaxID=1093978 RepID=A0AAV4EDV2_9GAST|nr:CCHC-type zinc finger, nucleic acid binding protein a [Elysia marginata]
MPYTYPHSCRTFFSVRAATHDGADIKFSKSEGELHCRGTTFNIHRDGQLYYLNSTSNSKTASHTLQEWHVILGHCNKADILKLQDKVDGMIISDKSDFDCEVCVLGKMTETRRREPDQTARKPLDVVHVELAGPVDPPNINGMKYSFV